MQQLAGKITIDYAVLCEFHIVMQWDSQYAWLWVFLYKKKSAAQWIIQPTIKTNEDHSIELLFEFDTACLQRGSATSKVLQFSERKKQHKNQKRCV